MNNQVLIELLRECSGWLSSARVNEIEVRGRFERALISGEIAAHETWRVTMRTENIENIEKIEALKVRVASALSEPATVLDASKGVEVVAFRVFNDVGDQITDWEDGKPPAVIADALTGMPATNIRVELAYSAPFSALPVAGSAPNPRTPNYKFKFETLVEHAKRQDAEIAALRYDQNIRRFYDEGAVWFWCGDETDNLPTLACPVVINAGDLRALIAAEETVNGHWRGIPLGFALVPVEPTKEIVEAMQSQLHVVDDFLAGLTHAYRAMVKVAGVELK